MSLREVYPPSNNQNNTIMKRWTLFVVRGGEREEGTDRQADNLEEAEKVAKELYKEYDDGNYCDLMVFCAPHHDYNNDYAEHHPDEDFPVWSKDCCGDSYWRVMRVDDYGLLGLDFDKDFIQEIKDYENAHKPRHIENLSEEELKDLFTQITPGSICLNDYANDYNVDEKEVLNWIDGFDEDLANQIRDEFPTITDHDLDEAVEARETAQNFADYVMTIPF